MSRLYQYVGPTQILEDVRGQPPGTVIESNQDVIAWLNEHEVVADADDCITVTFVVTSEHQFLIADRHSEHVACAQGGPVFGAGEATFELNPEIRIVDISNQSTGFCPEPDCWSDVQVALEQANISHPGQFTRSFQFRLCPNCGQRNLIKDQWFQCGVCSHELPLQWNFDLSESS